VGQGKGVAELMGDAPDEDGVEFSQRHVAILVIIQDRHIPGDVLEILNDGVQGEAYPIGLGREAAIGRMLNEGFGLFVPGGQIAEDQDRFVLERNPGSLDCRSALGLNSVAGAHITLLILLETGAGVSGFRFLALDQVDNQLAVRIPREVERLRAETRPRHAVAVKGSDVFEDRLQTFTIPGLWRTAGRGEVNDVQLPGHARRTWCMVGIDKFQGSRSLLRLRDWWDRRSRHRGLRQP
jgi:hypothetical protein